MPFKSKRRYRRRRARPARTRRRRRTRKRLPPIGFGLKHRCRLRYTDVITLDASANTTAMHGLRCNNVYDPDATGGGHQPRHFDLLAEVYDNYTVVSSKITAKIVGYDGAGGDAAQAVGIRASPDLLLESPNMDIPALHEMGRTANTTWTMVKSTEPLQTRQLTKSWSQRTSRALGGPTSDDVLSGSTDGNGPARQDYFTLFTSGAGMDALGNPRRLNIMVTIDYVVVFSGVKGNLPED